MSPLLSALNAPANASGALFSATRVVRLIVVRSVGAGIGWVIPFTLLVVWEATSALGWVAPHLLPPPTTLFNAAVELSQRGELTRHIVVSTMRVAAGFAIGIALALAAGTLVAQNRTVARLFDPTLQALRAVPSLAWVPLLLLWLGIDAAPKITLIAIGTFFPTYLATVSGLTNVDRKLVEVGRQLGLGPRELMTRISLPAASPAIFTGIRTSAGLGWMFLVAAELMAATSGLGYLLTEGRETGRADLVLVAIITLALVGKVSDSILAAIERRWLGWRDLPSDGGRAS